MPIISVAITGQAQRPDGTVVQVAPKILLAKRGPIVQVTLQPTDQLVVQLQQSGASIPQPVSGQALIDTGASMSCIDNEAAVSLGLPVVNVIQMASASHAKHPANVYPVKMEITSFTASTPLAAGAPLKSMGLVALIGRDILSSCQLVYNGTTGQITLAI